MPLATRRSYAGAAPACTLSSDISAGATSFSITGTTTNWPTTATGPFYMVIDPGLSTEEKVLVGARTSGSLSSVTRGVDGTTAASHVTGATCYPVFTAVDANDANLLASRLSAKGDLISSDGTDPTKVAVGSNNTRLVADSAQTSGIKWVADTQNTVVDAKGDLLVGSAADTVARLAVGSDGHVLVADSTATNGLSYSPLNGWRNAIINGDFSVNQRAFSSGTLGSAGAGTYGFDRWTGYGVDGTTTMSSQAFTVGNPISGQEPSNFLRLVTTGQTLATAQSVVLQRIEGVRTFAGQQVTLSLWAKANSGTPKIAIEYGQEFGTSGSAQVQTYAGQITLSTSWQRFTVTTTLPSISGKTVGTANDCLIVAFYVSAGSNLNSRTGSLGIQSNTFDIWGVQVEAGPDATTFERRPQQVELALCQRYYVRFAHPATTHLCIGMVYPTNNAYATIQLPVRMRAAPTSIASSGILYGLDAGGTGRGWTAVAMSSGQVDTLGLNFTGGFNFTNGHAVLCAFSTAPSYIEVLGAEL